MHSCMDVCFACQGASCPLPYLLSLAAPLIILRRAWSTTLKRTLRSKRLRYGKSMQDVRPTSNGTSRALPWATVPKQLHIFTSIRSARNDHRGMQTTTSRKRQPLLAAVEEGGWGANAHDSRRWKSSLRVGHGQPVRLRVPPCCRKVP